MFFELDQISRAQKTTQQLQKSKEKLHNLVVDAYQSIPRVKQSLTSTISGILEYGKKRSQVFGKIEDDSLHGYLIPSFIDYQRFSEDKGELPQWTRNVFQNQFQKQKKSLDILAKKIYAAHSLTQAKDNHLRQLNSFKMLSDRYRALSEHDQTIDIMNEAQRMKNLTKLTSQKFLSYLQVISSKLIAFVQEMTSKCQNFGNQLNKVSTKTATNYWVHPEAQNYNPSKEFVKANVAFDTRNQGQNWLARVNRTLDKNFHKTAKNPQDYLLRQPKWLSTFSSDYYI